MGGRQRNLIVQMMLMNKMIAMKTKVMKMMIQQMTRMKMYLRCPKQKHFLKIMLIQVDPYSARKRIRTVRIQGSVEDLQKSPFLLLKYLQVREGEEDLRSQKTPPVGS